MRRLVENDLIYWVGLNLLIEPGKTPWNKNIAQYMAVSEIFGEIIKSRGFKSNKFAAGNSKELLSNAKFIIEECSLCGCEIISYFDSRYPERLREIYSPPPVLFARGKYSILSRLGQAKAVCIVGARECTPYGEKVTRMLTRDLVLAGLVTVSGFAMGIDSIVHEETIRLGGETIAVLGCGLDIDYPQKNSSLRREMLNSSALFVSEYPPKVKAARFNFPIRNRIMAGLSDGVLVTEASLHSGSLITANLCLEHGKDVFSVPRNIDEPNSQGCNKLLKDGAVVVTEASDVLFVLQTSYPQRFAINAGKGDVAISSGQVEYEKIWEQHRDLPDDLSEIARTIYKKLNKMPQDLDSLVLQSGLEPSDVLVALTELECLELVKAEPGGRYRL